MTLLSLSLLGPFQATLAGDLLTGFESNKVRALLAYLAVEADRPHPREILAGLFWPESPQRSARANLRHILADLRRVIGDCDRDPPFLLASRQTIQFNPHSDVWLDVTHFSRVADAADRTVMASIPQLAEAAALYQGPFLDGFSVRKSAAFEEWLLLRREWLLRQAVATYQRLADHYERRGDYQQAMLYTQRQLELEPWRELAHRQMMRLLALSGQRGAALTHYEKCRSVLAEELGVEPEAETTGLYERIVSGALDRAAERSAVEAAVIKSRSPDPLLLIDSVSAKVTFVGRQQPLARLDEWLNLSLTGLGRVGFVAGEAGSGKTTLLQEFARRAQDRYPDLVAARGSCNAHTSAGDPYLPFCQILRLLTGMVTTNWDQGVLNGINACRLRQMLSITGPALISHGPDLIDTLLPSGPLLAQAAKATASKSWPGRLERLIARKQAAVGLPPPPQSALLEQVIHLLAAVGQARPLLLILDDLQWIDTGSVNLLFHAGRQLAGSRILMVGAYRPEEVAVGRAGGRHPLEPVLNEFRLAHRDIILPLDADNDRRFMAALLDSQPNRLDDGFRQQLYRLTRGHPLFTLELLRDMRDRGDLRRDATGHWVESQRPDWTTLPAQVEAAIGERLARLAPELLTTLRVASIEGETFTAEVVARVLRIEPHRIIRQLSGVLDRQHVLVTSQGSRRIGLHRLSRYRFRHSLFQNYLYHSLSQIERSYLHEQVGRELERLHGEQTEAIAGELARHFVEAGLIEPAISYLRRAGDQAVRLSAHETAIEQYRQGLAFLLKQLPDSPERARLELGLQLGLNSPLVITKGFDAPEVVQVFDRTQALSRQMLETSIDAPDLFPTLYLIFNGYFAQGNYRTALEWAEQMVDYARNRQQLYFQALANLLLGSVILFLGKFTTSLIYFEKAESQDSFEPNDASPLLSLLHPKSLSLSYSAWLLGVLGYADQARSRSWQAVAIARQLDRPFNLAHTLAVAGLAVHATLRDWVTVIVYIEELSSMLSEYAFPHWLACFTTVQGRVWVEQDQFEQGIAKIEEGLSIFASATTNITKTFHLHLLIEAHQIRGDSEAGLQVLSEAFTYIEQSDERFYEAELHRLKGELLLQSGDGAATEAERCFEQAIAVGQRQEAKLWELRATVSLARLWQGQGKSAEAKQRLAGIYNRFTEGFDTADLQEARLLLDELASA